MNFINIFIKKIMLKLQIKDLFEMRERKRDNTVIKT